VSTDEHPHIALPQLYGAPAYARPPTVAETAERPFDPDELPIEAYQTDEEREFSTTLPAQAYAPGGVLLGRGTRTDAGVGDPLRPRSLSLRGIAGRLLGGD
jgi:hypothetical protein